MYTWFADHPDADILLHSNANKSAVILYPPKFLAKFLADKLRHD